MRLAYLSTDPGIAYGGRKGASVHLAEIVGALAARQNEVLVLVAASTSGASLPRGVTVEVLPGPGKSGTTTERLGFEEDLTAWLTARLEDFQPVALYERLALHSAAGTMVARRIGIPHLLEVNAPLLEEAERYRGLEEPRAAALLERTALSGADLVFAVSPPLAQMAATKGAHQVEVLQNAADIERFPPPTRNGASPVAVFSGSLRPWHGIDTIVDAWRLLGAAAPPLLVVGDGPARSMLHGLNVQVIGSVPQGQIPALLAGAHIGLAPHSAGAPRYFSPLKVFEYLAAGLATVVADLPAVTAVVDADSAVVIPSGDARALADAVARLCADPSERERLGSNARALVASAHTWAHRADRIMEAVETLTAAKARPA